MHKIKILKENTKEKGYNMRKKEIIKNTNGITLVSLVITIIILIILAAVTINLTIGADGIITRAKNAKENMELAVIEEEERLNQLYGQLNFEGSDTEGGDSSSQGGSTNTPTIPNETIRYNAQTDMVQLKDANGNWVDWKNGGLLWNGCLFDGGNYYEQFTGGWYEYLDEETAWNMELSDVLTISGGKYANKTEAIYGTGYKIDLSKYTKIRVRGTIQATAANTYTLPCTLGLSTSTTLMDFSILTLSAPDKKTVQFDEMIDISSYDSKYYFLIRFNTQWTGNIKITSIQLLNE